MEIIENYYNVDEIDKKATVTKALNRLIMIDLTLSEIDQTIFLSTINNLIEIIIMCSKNKNVKNHKLNKNVKQNSLEEYDDIDDIILANSGHIIHSLTDKICTIVIKKQYNADKLFVNMGTITDILMILVNKYNYLTSIEKKMIVLQTVNKFIRERLEFIIDLPKDKKERLILSIDSIPITIDLFIALQYGKYKINRTQIIQDEKIKRKSSIFCCFGRNNDE